MSTSPRTRRPLVIIGIVAVLAVVAVAVSYLAFFSDDAPEPLALSDQGSTPSVPTPPAPGAGAAPGELAGTWRAVSGSEAGYRIREKLAALPAQSDAVGRSPAVTGSVKVDRTGEFVSTQPVSLPDETASGQAAKASAEGDLTLHGVTKRVKMPLDIRVTGGRGELVGLLRFPMSDFNITPPSIAGFVTVDPDATLEFKLVLEKV